MEKFLRDDGMIHKKVNLKISFVAISTFFTSSYASQITDLENTFNNQRILTTRSHQVSPLTKLPTAIINNISYYLNPKDVAHLSEINKGLHKDLKSNKRLSFRIKLNKEMNKIRKLEKIEIKDFINITINISQYLTKNEVLYIKGIIFDAYSFPQLAIYYYKEAAKEGLIRAQEMMNEAADSG